MRQRTKSYIEHCLLHYFADATTDLGKQPTHLSDDFLHGYRAGMDEALAYVVKVLKEA